MTITNPFIDGTCTVAAWEATKEYCAGLQVSHKGIIYQSDWCTKNEPGTAQYIGWTSKGTCAVKYDTDMLGFKNMNTQIDDFVFTVANFVNPSTQKICTNIITANENINQSSFLIYLC